MVAALVLLAVYALTPPPAGEAPAEWRAQIDRGRIWLGNRASALRGLIAAE